MGARTLPPVGALGTRSATDSPLRVGEGSEEGLSAASCNNPDLISRYRISVWLMLAGGLIGPAARLL